MQEGESMEGLLREPVLRETRRAFLSFLKIGYAVASDILGLPLTGSLLRRGIVAIGRWSEYRPTSG